MGLPEPGEIVFYDYRTATGGTTCAENNAGRSSHNTNAAADNSDNTAADELNGGSTGGGGWRGRASRRALRLVQFNVERGYELARVIDELRRLDPDVVALQECDVGCDRSGGADVGRAVARALGLCGFFLCEFTEIRSPLRDLRAQGGGAHGNAILSRYDLRHARCVAHSRRPVDWDLPPGQQPHALAKREPRRGRRAALAARVFPPWLSTLSSPPSQPPPPGREGDEGGESEAASGGGCCGELDGVLVYSAHLEVFCGAADRAAQYADVVADARRERRREEEEGEARGGAGGRPEGDAAAADDSAAEGRRRRRRRRRPWRHAILGDLNTMGHGVARLSPHYARGPLRWRSLGLTEGEWFERHVLLLPPPPPSGRRRGAGGGGGGEEEAARAVAAAAARRRLERWGAGAEAARALVPNPGFSCPFAARDTITLDNPSYRLRLPRWAAALLPGARCGGGDGGSGDGSGGGGASGARGGSWWLPLMAGKLDWVLLHERGFRVERAFLGNASFSASDHAWLAVDAEVL